MVIIVKSALKDKLKVLKQVLTSNMVPNLQIQDRFIVGFFSE